MKRIIPLILIALAFLVGLYFYHQLPERMASHWGLYGEVNGYMSKFWGTFFMPFLSVGLYLLFLIIPAIDPKAKNIEKFRGYFDTFIIILFGFLLYLHILTIVWNLGYKFQLLAYLSPAFAALFYFSGTLISKAEPNWTIGIRTPWTLSNDTVWKKTHLLAGKLFRGVAVVTLLGMVFPSEAMVFLFIGVVSVSLFLVIYSYTEFKKVT